MSKELEPSNNLIEDRPEEEEDEEDEEEDDDYDPDKDDEAGGSEIDEDDEIDDEPSKKSAAKGKTLNSGGDNNGTSNNNSSAIEETPDGLVKIDEDKITLLWSEFCKDDDEKAEEKQQPPKVEKEVVTKQYDFAGETITVQEEVLVTKPADSKSNDNPAQSTSTSNGNSTAGPPSRPSFKRPTGGLSGILGALKKPKMSTLTKSLHDWKDFKKKENLEEELGQHRRSKDSFLERQAFLGRTDLREFEREKSIRDHERKVREQNSKPKP